MSTPPRVIAVIPARMASQRLPGKPLADICGQPMIVHVIHRTRKASLIDEVLVATDDAKIAAAAHSAGCRAIMTSSDLQSGTDRIAAALREYPHGEIIVNVQGDEPLIPPAMIDQAVRPLLDDQTLVAGTLVTPITSKDELLNPSLPKVVLDKNGFCLYFSRSPIPHVRDIPVEEWAQSTSMYRHIGLYVYRREFLFTYTSLPQLPLEKAEKLEQLRVLEHGYKMKATVTDLESISVDTPGDLEKVRALMGSEQR